MSEPNGNGGGADWDDAPALLIPVPVSTVGGAVFAGDSIVTGWSFKETTGATSAEVWLIDGQDANGNPFAFITLLAGQSVRDVTNDRGLRLTTGLFVRVVSGTVQGSVWAVDV